MIHEKLITLGALLFFFNLFCFSPVRAGVKEDCSVSVKLYNQAAELPQNSEKVFLLQQALTSGCREDKILAHVHNNLANVFEEQGQLGQAEKQYLVATEKDPLFSIPWLSLGDLYKKQGQEILSQKMYDKGFVLDQYQSLDQLVENLSPKRTLRRKRAPGAILYFGYDNAALSQATIRQLESFRDALQSEELQNYKFKLVGHTDAKGSADYNQTLSESRAQSVKSWLARYLDAEERLLATGYGETQPVADNSDAEGRRQNRRVEVSIAGVSGRVRKGCAVGAPSARLGVELMAAEQYGEAADSFEKALELCTEENVSAWTAGIRENLTVIYSMLGKWDLAARYAE